MKQFWLCLGLLLVSCRPGPDSPPEAATASTYPYREAIDKFAMVDMPVDLSFLSDSELRVLSKLGELARVIDALYLNQVYAGNPEVRAAIAASDSPQKDETLTLFDIHFGPWDSLNEDKAFFGRSPRPAGAGVYPTDLTKEEFQQWIADHPEDRQAFESGYTVIRREADGLVAIPYRSYYHDHIQRAAELMEEAAELSENESLKSFLELRAKAFRSDEYRESEMAWMDLDGSIEVAVGPYEVYMDRLMGLKTFFEIFITVRNPEETAKLERYKGYLPEFERNLPLPDEHKNMKRGSESPLAVVDQVGSGGDARPGVQTVAFNLPNDEVVREQKGSKKVLLRNVMQAKFEQILLPIGQQILDESQRDLLDFEWFFNEVLFHELSHGLGPGTIEVDGRSTTVGAVLQETYPKIEEGKADIMGMYNLLYLMNKGEMAQDAKPKLIATYFAGLFRSMRFGIHEAHGAGAAFQYNLLAEKGAFTFDPDKGTYLVDVDAVESAITEMLGDVCMIQALGDYDAAVAYLARYAVETPEVTTALAKLFEIKVDIWPSYPSL